MDTLSKSSRDFNHRARGLLVETRSRFSYESVPDDILVERVRSKLGRVVSHPHAIGITARDGSVVVSGAILADQADELIHCVARVRGVRNVRNLLELHQIGDTFPAHLLAQAHQPRARLPLGAATRLLGVGIAGSLVSSAALFAARRRFLLTGLCVGALGVFSTGLRLGTRGTQQRRRPVGPSRGTPGPSISERITHH